MAITISGTYTSTLTLALASTNPATITTAGRMKAGVEAFYANQTLVNAGSITAGSGGNGIVVDAGASLTNQSRGFISGYYGIDGGNGAVSVLNAGTIFGANTGIYLHPGSPTVTDSVTNQTGASIAGGINGIVAEGAPANLLNAGSITGSTSFGVSLYAGGSITNQAGAAINGGISADGALTLTNAGSIVATGSDGGVVLGLGGSITNQASATIKSTLDGIYDHGFGASALTVVNAGIISGGTAHATQAGIVLAGAATITNQAASVISGHEGIYATGGATTVTNAGTITGVMGIDFAAADTGSQTVVNTGTIIGTGGTAIAFSGTGSNLLVLEPGFVLKGIVTGGAGAANTVQLVGSAATPVTATYGSKGLIDFQTLAFGPAITNDATLIITSDTQLPALITGFTGPLDGVDLTALPDSANKASTYFNAATDLLTITSGSASVELNLDHEDYSNVHFVAEQAKVGGTEIQGLPSPTVTAVTTSPGSGTLVAGKTATFTVTFSETVTVSGTPTLLLNDGGTATYNGGSGKNALNFLYTVAVGQVTPDVTVTGVALNGGTIQDGIGNPAILSGAVTNPPGVLDINAPLPPTNTFLLADIKTKVTNAAAVGVAYTGSVAGVIHQYTTASSDGLNITTSTPGWFIQTGSGNDGINVSKGGGNNILDGGTGSNFLVGGKGDDLFFLDDRAATTIDWSSIAGFHAGDTATIWGLTPADFTITQTDNEGAAGYKGLTFACIASGKPQQNLTIAGYTAAEVQSGHLTVSYGTGAADSEAPGSHFMLIQAS